MFGREIFGILHALARKGLIGARVNLWTIQNPGITRMGNLRTASLETNCHSLFLWRYSNSKNVMNFQDSSVFIGSTKMLLVWQNQKGL